MFRRQSQSRATGDYVSPPHVSEYCQVSSCAHYAVAEPFGSCCFWSCWLWHLAFTESRTQTSLCRVCCCIETKLAFTTERKQWTNWLLTCVSWWTVQTLNVVCHWWLLKVTPCVCRNKKVCCWSHYQDLVWRSERGGEFTQSQNVYIKNNNSLIISVGINVPSWLTSHIKTIT